MSTSNGHHPPGTIALPAGELARFSAFSYSLGCLQYPPGTTISMVQSLSIPRNLNTIIREMKGEWVWLQADDHVFEADLLLQLLDRELDVVVPLIVRRRPPFSPVLFKSETEEGYLPFAYDELPETGLLEVYSAGTGGMLIRKHVLDAIGDPWFGYREGEVLSEDVDFCKKIRAAGFKIYADMDARMGHCGLFIAWPYCQEGHWGINVQMGQGPTGSMNAIFIQPGERELPT